MKAFLSSQMFEVILIIVVLTLMFIFSALYFLKNKQYKKLHTSLSKENPDEQYLSDLKITEKLQFYEAKLDLYEKVGSVGIIIFDYEPEEFYIDKNGLLLLAREKDLTHKEFESLIHDDERDIYESMFECENVKYSETGENTYVMRIKAGEDYRRFLFRIHPLYNGDGAITILTCAFIDLGV